MKPLISVITPASRGIKVLSQLIRDFRNQTLSSFEHIIVFDGKPPVDVMLFMDQHKNDYNINFVWINKDLGDMHRSPGTIPRNHGTMLAKADWIVYADDDDRYSDRYLESLINGVQENTISVVQMSCSESRIKKNGDPTRIRLIPEIGVPIPTICHIGTPCFLVPRKWAIENPWRHEPEHDYRFISRIIQKYNPIILFKPGMLVDVDGLVLQGMVDWVSIPPFYREK